MNLVYSPAPNRTTKPRAFSLDEALFARFAEACRRTGRKQNMVLEALMRAYVGSEEVRAHDAQSN